GEEITLPDCETCVLAGQYVFYVPYAYPYSACPTLYALDLNTRITYTLAQLRQMNGYYGLEATGQAVYLFNYNAGSISRICVHSGAMRLDTVAQFDMGWN
ncbi:MAG: hypothetical protein AAGU32_22805, partial [Bacillota bacterium]